MKAFGRSPVSRQHQKVIIGPWTHSLGNLGASTSTGDIDFSPSVRVDLTAEQVRWFDYWLKGIENGVTEEPPVSVFVMGANQWQTAGEWPVAGTKFIPFFLHGQGKANSLFGDGLLSRIPPDKEPADQFKYDPLDPVPTIGGSTGSMERLTPTPMGPRDQRPIEWRPDVVVYTSGLLESPVTAIGPVKLVLFAASDAPDTDFTATLVDVFPNGFAMNVAGGIIRGRYRDSMETPSLLEPGRVYRYEIDMGSTAICFQRGHRIRVDISSSNFPQFDRNLNTGQPFASDSKPKIANQTIFHSEEHPSYLVLPLAS